MGRWPCVCVCFCVISGEKVCVLERENVCVEEIVFLGVCVCVRVWERKGVYVCLFVCVRLSLSLYIYIYICIYTYIYTCTYRRGCNICDTDTRKDEVSIFHSPIYVCPYIFV